MRKIGDHFRNERGQAAFHYAVIYADEWSIYGFPDSMTLHQRCVWSYLFHRTCHHHCSVGEIACKVLGSRNNRPTIRKTLVSLQKLGLVDRDDDGWYSILPDSNSNQEELEGVGRNLPQVNIDPIKGVESYPVGKNLPPNGVEGYPPPGVDTDPGRKLPQVESYPPPGRFLPTPWVDTDPMVGRNLPQREIDIERQEETTTTATPPRDVGPSIEQMVSKARKVGVEEAISLHPVIFEEPVCLPTEELDYKRFMAVAIAIAVDRTIAKNEEKGRESSITGLITSISKSYTAERWQAEQELDQYLANQTRKKTAEARKAKTAQAAEIPKCERFPTAPPFDPALDDPETRPVEWLRDRMPDLSQRLLEIECSDQEDLNEKLQAVSNDALDAWRQTTNRTGLRVTQQRKQFISTINPILLQFEARKVSL